MEIIGDHFPDVFKPPAQLLLGVDFAYKAVTFSLELK